MSPFSYDNARQVQLTPDETVQLCEFIKLNTHRLSAGEHLAISLHETVDGDAVFAKIGGVLRNITLYTKP